MFSKNKPIVFIISVVMLIVLSSCNRMTDGKIPHDNQALDSKKMEYLSITYTKYKDNSGPENGMTIGFVKYDIQQKLFNEVFNTDYSSQYPLGVISVRDKKVYYTAESETREGNDEVYSYDISTKKIEQLTDGLFAINYILPRKNDIIIVGVKRGTSAIRLSKYDKKLKKLYYNNLEDDDTCVEYAGLNTSDSNELYTVTYSDNSRRKSSELQALRKVDHYVIPNYTITKYDDDISNPVQLSVVENRIVRSISGNGKYLITKEVDNLELDTYKVYIQDLKTKEKAPIEIEGIAKCKDLQIDSEGKKIYFIGILDHSEERAIFCYDIKLKTLDKIFSQDKEIGYVNNFTLVYE